MSFYRLQKPDCFYLSAAVGWLELGDWQEANAELERVRPELRGHGAVLAVRHDIYAKAQKWDMAGDVAEILRKADPHNPHWWIASAYSTRRREGGGLRAAQSILRDARERFPKEATIGYNLACYSCQLGNTADAQTFLKEAFSLGDAARMKLMALDDPDLEPLWANIGTI